MREIEDESKKEKREKEVTTYEGKRDGERKKLWESAREYKYLRNSSIKMLKMQ